MTNDGPGQTWDGKTLTPIHDRLYRRPSAGYAPDAMAEPPSACPEPPPAPCVEVMEQTAHASVRTLLQALFAVDIDDPDSIEAFQNRRRRDADLHQMMEKALSDTVWGAAKFAVAAIAVLALLHFKEILAWFGKP